MLAAYKIQCLLLFHVDCISLNGSLTSTATSSSQTMTACTRHISAFKSCKATKALVLLLSLVTMTSLFQEVFAWCWNTASPSALSNTQQPWNTIIIIIIPSCINTRAIIQQHTCTRDSVLWFNYLYQGTEECIGLFISRW